VLRLCSADLWPIFGAPVGPSPQHPRDQARILVIPGNHDSPRRIAFAAELFEAVGIHLVSDIRLAPALVLERMGSERQCGRCPS